MGGFGCCGSFGSWGSLIIGGRTTGSRLLLTLPFPFNLAARDSQHSAQMSYSLPSMSFCRHSLACSQRSQTTITYLPVFRIRRSQWLSPLVVNAVDREQHLIGTSDSTLVSVKAKDRGGFDSHPTLVHISQSGRPVFSEPAARTTHAFRAYERSWKTGPRFRGRYFRRRRARPPACL
jgi:hypothetical protein